MTTPPMTGPESGIALALLRELLDLDAGGREALLRQRCAGDAGLRSQVLALLASDACADPALDAPLTIEPSGIPEPIDPLPGSRLGPFRVLERIGRGGMGTVYRAVRENGDFAQEVAIKMIRRGLDSDDILARFLRERRILARLTHPNLARLVDGGPGPDGRPWFAMEFIHGASLTDWCDQRQLALRQRIALFLDACAAVQHAHERLVVHRDLKPANILVDDGGHVRLLDFGIAKLVGGDDQGDPAATAMNGPRMFTPAYAAPEQLAGGEIGVATDIHALGVILFELISGTLPYPGSRSGEGRTSAGGVTPGPARLASAITQGESEEAGTLAGDRLAQRSISLAGYRQLVRGDLERIVATAMAQEPARRYATVQALSDDLARYLRGEPVAVTGDDWRYRLGKFVGRHRWPVALAGLTAISLAIGIAGVLWQANRAAHAAERALTASERAAVVKDFLASLLGAANPFVNPGQTPTVRDLLEQAGRRIDDEFARQPALAAELHGLVGRSYRGLGEMTSAERHLEKAIDLIDQVDLAPRQRAEIRSEYAHALIGGNRSEQALAVAQQALADLEGMADAGPSRARALLVQATAHMMLGQPALGLAAQVEAVDHVCIDDQAPDQDCVGALIELKYFHEGVGDEPAALAVAERAWHGAEALHGERPHPQRVMAAGAYGDALAWADRAGEAIAVLEPAVRLAHAIYGEDNFRHARALEWLATAYIQAGRSSEALAVAERTLAIGSSSAPGNPRIPVWLHRIVSLLLDLQRPEEAAQVLAEQSSGLPAALPAPMREAMDLLDLRVALARAPRSAQQRDRLQALRLTLADADSSYLDQARLLSVRAALDDVDPATAAVLLAQVENAEPGNGTSAAWLRLDAWRLRLQGTHAQAQAQAALGLEQLARNGQAGAPWAAELHTELGLNQCLAGDRAAGQASLDAAERIWAAHAAGPGAFAAVAAARRQCDPEPGAARLPAASLP